MLQLNDTIAAIATPVGSGGVGIVKLSGPEALPILERVFRWPGQARPFQPRYLHYGHIQEPETQHMLDEVLVVYMPAPHSYTCQDVVEIHCHGGPVVTQQVLQLALSHGARPAEAGEMTLRAFINGRLDLSQAEAVLDVINAKTEASLRVAAQQLSGRLSGRVSEVRQVLLHTLAFLEASIDFVEEDIPDEAVVPALEDAAAKLRALQATASQGIIYRQGIRTAIVGRPNVGKSSLLNALLRGDRAIVTDIPGTTRDTLEETANIGGVPLVLIDTAGIRSTPSDAVEQIGIDRSRSALQQADLALMVVDGSEPLSEGDWDIAGMLGPKATLLIVNKQDLPQQGVPASFLPGVARIAMSVVQGAGLEILEKAIIEQVAGGHITSPDELLVSNPRHQALLLEAGQHVSNAITAQQQGLSPDLVSIDVREAVETLGQITGEDAGEDLLNTIFSRFCIGK